MKDVEAVRLAKAELEGKVQRLELDLAASGRTISLLKENVHKDTQALADMQATLASKARDL